MLGSWDRGCMPRYCTVWHGCQSEFSGCPLADLKFAVCLPALPCAVTNTVAVPCSVLVPFIALVFGVYPLVLNRQFALAATLYYTSSTLVTMVSSSGGAHWWGCGL